jgi:phenylacetate-CoA ligase
MKEYEYDYVLGYPSALTMVAQYLIDHDTALRRRAKAVITASETLAEEQRKVIEAGFGARASTRYSCSEMAVSMSQCDRGVFHEDAEYCFVEFVPIGDGNGDLEEIVATSFINPAMPLIRYRTGDLVRGVEDGCRCGRSGRCVAQIDGRIEGAIRTPDGRVLTRLDFLFKRVRGLRAAQLEQVAETEVILRLVVAPEFSDKEQTALASEMGAMFGKRMRVRWEYVEALPKERNGKVRQIRSVVGAGRR